MKNKVKIVIPKGATSSIELGLVELTRQLRLKTGQESSFGLGGKDGYGIEFENNTFMMHPYCWCEEDSCQWCSGDAPNFLFKPTGCKIRWYKWIGRDQRQEGKLPKDWLTQCVNSIWKKDDCYYEFDIQPKNIIELLNGEEKRPKVTLCFNVFDPNAIVEAELSPFADVDNVFYWGIEEIISDIANAKLEETDEYRKAIELNKKYPALREKIRKDAIRRNQERIEWHKQRIKELKKQNENHEKRNKIL